MAPLRDVPQRINEMNERLEEPEPVDLMMMNGVNALENDDFSDDDDEYIEFPEPQITNPLIKKCNEILGAFEDVPFDDVMTILSFMNGYRLTVNASQHDIVIIQLSKKYVVCEDHYGLYHKVIRKLFVLNYLNGNWRHELEISKIYWHSETLFDTTKIILHSFLDFPDRHLVFQLPHNQVN